MTHDDLRRTVGARLRQARLDVGKTQEAVGADMRRSRQAVSAWERGETMPTLLEFVELVELYGATADQVLFGVQDVSGQCELAILRAGRGAQDFAESGFCS